MTCSNRLLSGAILLISVIGTRSLLADPTAAACTGHAWFSTGAQGTFTYYLNGSHSFPATAQFTLSGWSETTNQLSTATYYPYDDKISDNGAAILLNPRLEVTCWHYAAGYDTGVEAMILGSAQQYLVVGENCDGAISTANCTGAGSGGGDTSGYCLYEVKADDFGNPIVDGSGNYQLVAELGCYG